MYESRQATHEVVVLSSIVYVRRLIFNDKRFLPIFPFTPQTRTFDAPQERKTMTWPAEPA